MDIKAAAQRELTLVEELQYLAAPYPDLAAMLTGVGTESVLPLNFNWDNAEALFKAKGLEAAIPKIKEIRDIRGQVFDHMWGAKKKNA